MDVWCEQNTTLSGLGLINATFANASAEFYLHDCGVDYQYATFLNFLRSVWQNWTTMPSLTHGVLVATFAGNLFLIGELCFYIRVFRRLTRKGSPWSLLILSQLVSDNMVALTGMVSISEAWLFQLSYSNIACLSSLVKYSGGSVYYLAGVAFLSNQVLVLLNVGDRLQAILRPVPYMVHDKPRRCLLFNLIAYAAGLLTLPIHAYYSYALEDRRWYQAEKPDTWVDLVCSSRTAVEEMCRSGEGNFWWQGSEVSGQERNGTEVGVCRGPFEAYNLAYGQIFFLLSIIDLFVTLESLYLVLVYRRMKRNRVGTSSTPAMSKHEHSVTVSIIAEAVLVTLCSLANAASAVYFVAHSSSAASFTSSQNRSNTIIPAISYFVQVAFGSYTTLVFTSKEFRVEAIGDPLLTFLPEPKIVTYLSFHYLIVICLIFVFVGGAYLF